MKIKLLLTLATILILFSIVSTACTNNSKSTPYIPYETQKAAMTKVEKSAQFIVGLTNGSLNNPNIAFAGILTTENAEQYAEKIVANLVFLVVDEKTRTLTGEIIVKPPLEEEAQYKEWLVQDVLKAGNYIFEVHYSSQWGEITTIVVLTPNGSEFNAEYESIGFYYK